MSRPPATGLAAPPKSLHASERDTARVRQARADSRERLEALALAPLTCIDASGGKLAMTRASGRGPHRERVVGAGPPYDGPHVTMIAALALPGVEAVMTIDGATDADAVRASVEQGLCPTVTAWALGGMDNLRAHHVAGLRDRIAAPGARLMFGPPSSPDRSPIEPCWSTRNTLGRAVQARTRAALDAALQRVVAAVTPSKARGWCRHGGDVLRELENRCRLYREQVSWKVDSASSMTTATAIAISR